MIRLDQRNVDVQGTERVFKKVVHSGQNAIRFVDKDGVPMRVPNTSALSRLHSTYTLSPRGVPIRKSNHSYSGQLTQGKMQNMVNSLETTSQEMTSYTSMHSYGNGLSSAGSSRHYLSTANSQKRRSIGPPRSVKSMAKSASSQRSKRMLVSAPGLDSSVEPELENTNESPQGKRLGKEWSALSQCRALKRSSEIVSHRVDRMYFMSGNKLKLQSKYHVEDNELRHLRELQAARASSRASRDDMQSRVEATISNKKKYIDRDRLDKIEKKLSNIEHRLGFIEKQSKDVKHVRRKGQRSVHIKNVGSDEAISRSSSESGIHEERDYDEEDRDFIDRELSKRRSAKRENFDLTDENAMQGSIKRVEICPVPVKSREEQCAGVGVWDIMSHPKYIPGGTAMLKLFEGHPNAFSKNKATFNLSRKDYKKVNELTLGVPRKVRRAKTKSPKKQMPSTLAGEKELVGSAISPECRNCKCDQQRCKPKEQKINMLTIDTQQEQFIQSFPPRRQYVKLSYHPPVECECRLDPDGNRGPLLSITGHQVPLCDREVSYT